MDKYRVFDKIIKTKACTYFRGESIVTRQSFIIKKLNRFAAWQELLKNKDLSIMKNSKIKNFPVFHEIVKDEDQFYIVMETMHKNLQFTIKADIEKQNIFAIGRLLIQLAVNLSQKAIYPRQIRPSHIFIDQNLTTLKLYHLETMQKDISKLDLVQLGDVRYLSPQQILTTKQIDQRSIIFNIGLIICDLILGKSLIMATTKMQYIYELTRLFPQERLGNIQGSQHDIKQSSVNQSADNFDNLIRKYNFSNQFIAVLKQMLKLDRSERITPLELLDAWDVVIQNQKNYQKNRNILNQETQMQNKPNSLQYPINDQIDIELQFDFEQKPTLSITTPIKLSSNPLPNEKNVEDDVNQPIIIKKSKKAQAKHKLNSTKDSLNKSLNTATGKPASLSTIKKPQLTNYALNQTNLGIQMGMNPSIFSENQI